jgi:hypothetical protein
MGLYICIPDMEKIKQESYFLIYSSSPSLRLRYSPRRRRRTAATSYVAEVRPVRGSMPLTTWYHDPGDPRLLDPLHHHQLPHLHHPAPQVPALHRPWGTTSRLLSRVSPRLYKPSKPPPRPTPRQFKPCPPTSRQPQATVHHPASTTMIGRPDSRRWTSRATMASLTR